jgi:uncharacterized protein (TIGR00730 family)
MRIGPPADRERRLGGRSGAVMNKPDPAQPVPPPSRARHGAEEGQCMTTMRSVCVYCGSSGRVADVYKLAARRLGECLAMHGLQIVYGGGRVGLMGIVADAALAAGGRVVGIIPEHIQVLEVEHTALSELIVVDSMHTRKRLMVERSDAFIILPGGLGTLDELFEVLTWKQLALHDKPIIVVNVEGYWDKLLRLLEHMIAEGFAQPKHRQLCTIVGSVEEVLGALALQPEPAMPPQAKWL